MALLLNIELVLHTDVWQNNTLFEVQAQAASAMFGRKTAAVFVS